MEATSDFLFRYFSKVENCVPAHHHQCYELVYFTKGQGSTRIGDLNLEYTKSDYAIMRPLTIHDEKRDPGTETICAGLSFKESGLTLQEGLFSDDPKEPILPLLESMLKEKRDRHSAYKRMLDLLASQLAIRLVRRLTSGPSTPSDNKFQNTLDYMNNHFTEKIDFSALSAMAGYSYDRYRHIFKEKTGLSPVQYTMQKKMEYARTLLLHTRLPVSAIAMECGFSSDAQFCRQFKQDNNQTPLEYRESASRFTDSIY